MKSFAPRFALASLLFLTAAPALAGIVDLKGTKPGDLAFPGFVDADTCGNCHGGGVMGDKSYLPVDTWAGTMMGNAARDPVFFAALAIANQDTPGVGTYCLRCHSPIGFVVGHATPPDGSAFDAVDKQGIGCETCHRALTSAAPDAPYILSDAQLVFDEDTSKRGPYDPNAAVDPSVSPAHGTLLEPSLSESRFCGQCHQVTNPDVMLRDAAGVPTALEFPLDTTYEEWEHSDYSKAGGQRCADCHMAKKIGAHPVTKLPFSPMRTDPRDHAFVGGNHWGIQAVMAANPDRVTKFPDAFDTALQRTLDNLAKAVKVTLKSPPTTLAPGASFQLTVRVENLTGHKFPTGYAESRRAWIAVGVADASNHETEILGAYDTATGIIQAAPATHVYRAQHGRWDGAVGQPEEHLAQHDMIISDTRIPPLGFVASATTTPSAEIAFGDGQGGYNAFDEVTFTLDAPAGVSGDATLYARVYYQSMTREYIEFLKTANTTNTKGAELETIYQATGEAPPIPVATAGAPVKFPGGPSSSSSSDSTGNGGSGGGSGGSAPGGGGSGGSTPKDDGGCGCRAAGEGSLAAPLSAAAAALALAATRRRRRVKR